MQLSDVFHDLIRIDGITVSDYHGQAREECAEFIHASEKLERCRRGTNPTPRLEDDLTEDLTEEICDVLLCVYQLMIAEDIPEAFVARLMLEKQDRWIRRLEDARSKHENP